jgi:hypothetical protein
MTPPDTSEQLLDAFRPLSIPDPSPTVTVLREVTDEREQFTIRHEPMACPDVPPQAAKTPAGRRAHQFDTLTDLRRYIDHLGAGDAAIAFYTDEGVSCVLDEKAKAQKEVVRCSLERHHRFKRWQSALGRPMDLATFLLFLRTHGGSLLDVTQEALIGHFSSLTGTLVHGADEYLDHQSRSVKFTVKRKKRGGTGEEEREVDDVPTQFRISVPILADDDHWTELLVLVRMTGGPGAEIEFTLLIENLGELVADHIDSRLRDFADAAGFLCLRGQYREEPWAEPQLPRSVAELMQAQGQVIAAMHGHSPQGY